MRTCRVTLVTFVTFVTMATVLASGIAHAQDLAPPPPLPSEPAPAPSEEGDTRRMLEESERKDSERNFELFWARAEVGGSYLDMQQFSSSTFQLENAKGTGVMFGAALGARLLMFTLGPRFRYHSVGDFQFGQLNGELGFHFSFGRFDPFLSLHGGYSFVASGNLAQAASDVSVRGFNAGLSAGLDYYLTPAFSLGGAFTAEGLFLKRPPLALPPQFNQLPPTEQARIRSDPLYANSGSAAGFGAAITLNAGLHLGI